MKKKKKKLSNIPRNPAALPAKMRKNAGKMKDKKEKRSKENHNKDWTVEE
jgi:hypothetical protein